MRTRITLSRRSRNWRPRPRVVSWSGRQNDGGAGRFNNLVLETRAADHELTDDSHQLVEAVEIDTHHRRGSNRRNCLGFSGSGCRLKRRGFERQTVRLETVERGFSGVRYEDELEGNFTGAFDHRFRLGQSAPHQASRA
jgi:hypothetical protein